MKRKHTEVDNIVMLRYAETGIHLLGYVNIILIIYGVHGVQNGD